MATVPEGKVIRRLRGGSEALDGLLRDLKHYAFTGYVRTVRRHNGHSVSGVLGIKGGDLFLALRSSGPETLRGPRALEGVWSDVRDSECAIELHAKVDVDAIARDQPDAVLGRRKRIARREKPIPAAANHAALAALEIEVRGWREAGFDTTEPEAALRGDAKAAPEVVGAFRERVKRSLGLQEALDGLNVTGDESRARAIRAKLRDLRLVTVAEAELAAFRAAREIRHRADARAELAPPSVVVGKGAGHATSATPHARESLASPSSEIPTPEGEDATPPRDELTNLIRRYTFETFVVGPSNRFAHAAALAVAKSAKSAYNPLFLTSGSGLGKTHLLNAIGNAIVATKPGAQVVYRSAEVFANEFRQAKTAEALAAFRRRYRTVDTFLLDDVHILSGPPDVQEELFHTFDELTSAGRQIALTSDRPPKEIADLEDRLVSRFESGLVADIQAPDYDTRLAILRRKAAEVGGLPEDILAAIAKAVPTNVRELSGALNRVAAQASLLGQPVTLALAKQALADLTAAPGAGTRADDADRDLQPGRSFLIKETRPSECFRIFGRLAAHDGGLVITRSNPKRLRERFDFARGTVMWLTDRENASQATIAPQLERLMFEISSQLEPNRAGAILIDGVEYLVSTATFDAVLQFLRTLIDAVSESQVVLLVSLCAGTLNDQEIKTLEREMEVLAFP